MIARLEGILESVDPAGLAVVWPGESRAAGVAYEVMVPASSVPLLSLRVGQRVGLRTFQYLEQQAQGASFLPRMVGFVSEDDERLFELLTKVKGLGVKRALRAMAAPSGDIAMAIAGGDVAGLKGLPEIGKKLAETIILELKDKVGSLSLGATFGGGAAAPSAAGKGDSPSLDAARQAVEALVRLGEDRAEAESRVRRVLKMAAEGGAGMSADEILSASFGVPSGPHGAPGIGRG